jgi:MbtH protein
VGMGARKAECLRYIESVWTDMRPRSLREHIKATESLRENSESKES